MTVLAVTGMRREARLAGGPGLRAVCGAARVLALCDVASPGEGGLGNISGVISFGLAGALHPQLQPGDWVVADAVLCPDGRTPTDPAWTARLASRLPQASLGAVVGSDGVLLTRAARREARAAPGEPIAVDMESHLAGRLAARLGAPFAVARAISDSFGQDLPPAVASALSPDGRITLWPLLADLARNPRQLGPLVRVAVDAERAFRSLAGGRARLGPRLGGPDLGEPLSHMG